MSIYSPTTARIRGVSFTRLKFQCNIQNSLDFIVCLHFWLPFFRCTCCAFSSNAPSPFFISLRVDVISPASWFALTVPESLHMIVSNFLFFVFTNTFLFPEAKKMCLKKPETPTYMWTRLKKKKCDKYYHSVLLVIQAKLMFCTSLWHDRLFWAAVPLAWLLTQLMTAVSGDSAAPYVLVNSGRILPVAPTC